MSGLGMLSAQLGLYRGACRRHWRIITNHVVIGMCCRGSG